ncbi:hypothetical protein NN6n1_22910 [Shinella zoogloeoides]
MDESMERPTLKAGDRVKVRSGSGLERSRWAKKDVIGVVEMAEQIPAYGFAVRVQWPGEELDRAFQDANQFDIVSEGK